ECHGPSSSVGSSQDPPGSKVKDIFSKWKDYYIYHERKDWFWEKPVEIKKPPDQTVMSLELGDLSGMKQIVFNNNQVVVLGIDEMIVAAIDLKSSKLKDVKTFKHDRGVVSKIAMMSDLLILLKGDNPRDFSLAGFDSRDEDGLQSVRVEYHPKTGVDLTDFRPIILNQEGEVFKLLRQHIIDIFIHNTIFGALTVNGTLYLSVLDGCDHRSIERNCLPPIKLSPEHKSVLTHVAVTSERSLKVAVLNQVMRHQSNFWISRVHMLYIRAKR
ncbi:hypothetical protein EGW08_007511, partial [Elysia chlorotica]